MGRANIVAVLDGEAGATTRIACTDNSTQLPAGVRIASGKSARFATITLEDNDIRYTLGGSTPTQGASGLGHVLYPGDVLELYTKNQIDAFRHINAINSADAVIQVTAEY